MLKVGGLGPFVPRLEWAMLSAALSLSQRSQLLTHTVFAHFANLQKSPNLNGKYLFFSVNTERNFQFGNNSTFHKSRFLIFPVKFDSKHLLGGGKI
jgi:hypothetical protein